MHPVAETDFDVPIWNLFVLQSANTESANIYIRCFASAGTVCWHLLDHVDHRVNLKIWSSWIREITWSEGQILILFNLK